MADQDFEAVKRERGLPFPPRGNRFFIDRIEDNGVAVLLGPDGEKVNMPAKSGWKEGGFLRPSELKATEPAPVIQGQRKLDTGTGTYLDNHQPDPMAATRAAENDAGSMPGAKGWDWYAGGPVPNPTPPFRGPEMQAGPAPPTAAIGQPGASLVAMPSERGRTRQRRRRPVP